MIAWGRNMSKRRYWFGFINRVPKIESPKFRPHGLGLFCFKSILMIVYKITNIINDRVYYGSTKDFLNRKKTHIEDLFNKRHHNKNLQKDFDKYGASTFKFEIIKHFEKEQEMLVYEYQMINSKSNVYNILKTDYTMPLINENRNVKVLVTKTNVLIVTKLTKKERNGIRTYKRLAKIKNDNCYAKKQAKRLDSK